MIRSLCTLIASWICRDTDRTSALEHEIEERRRVEAELTEGKLRIRSILDTVVDGVVTIDERGIIESFNPAAERMFGYPAAEVIGHSIAMLMPTLYAAMHDAHLDRYRRTGERRIIGIGREVEGRRRDGTIFPIDLGVGEITLPGGRIFIGTIRDLTSHRELERQLRHSQKMEALGRLTGGIAHDFNNLLMVTILNLELLEECAEPDMRDQLVQPALRAALKASDLTRRLLAYSRRQPLSPQPVHLGDLVEDLRVMIERTLGEAFRVEIRAAPDLWPCLADPSQIESAILNLAINARDAMTEGGWLVIETANVDRTTEFSHALGRIPPGAYVRLAVRDEGAGIAPDLLERVIEPFFTTKAPGHGTGLGLSTIYGFVRQSGGHVGIDSAPGAGTVVTLYFPRLATAAGEHAA